MSTLLKTEGRSLVTTTTTTTRQIWVDDPIVPPITHPIITITPEPPNTKPVNPFVGPQLVNCIAANGKKGFMIWYYPPTGDGYPLSPCLISEGIGE